MRNFINNLEELAAAVQDGSIYHWETRVLPKIDLGDLDLSFESSLKAGGLMGDWERAAIAGFLRKIEARIVLEIGIWHGHCALELLDNVSTIERYIGVDLAPESKYLPAIPDQRDWLPRHDVGLLVRNHPRFELVTRPRGSLDLTPADLPRCDAVIIDGDHTSSVVTHDTELATAIVRPGGVIIWHDYSFWEGCEVPEVLHGLVHAGRDLRRIGNSMLAVEFR